MTETPHHRRRLAALRGRLRRAHTAVTMPHAVWLSSRTLIGWALGIVVIATLWTIWIFGHEHDDPSPSAPIVACSKCDHVCHECHHSPHIIARGIYCQECAACTTGCSGDARRAPDSAPAGLDAPPAAPAPRGAPAALSGGPGGDQGPAPCPDLAGHVGSADCSCVKQCLFGGGATCAACCAHGHGKCSGCFPHLGADRRGEGPG